MKISVITLFPQWIDAYAGLSILGRAQKAGVCQITGINPRDFTEDRYQKVDDAPYGGGVGMVMMCEPLIKAYESITPVRAKRKVLMMTPAGRPFTQAMAQSWATEAEELVFFCGHYEGIDARMFDLIPQMEPVSLGDFVMTGGELAALSMIDATVRLLPGALGKDASVEDESFSHGLLEYPQYTRPQTFRGFEVPEVLTSGNHAAIDAWRHQQALAVTQRFRPDLLS